MIRMKHSRGIATMTPGLSAASVYARAVAAQDKEGRHIAAAAGLMPQEGGWP